MSDFLKIGEITKPQGIFGEVKVRPYVDDADCFYDLKQVLVGDKPYKIAKARVVGNDVFLNFYGVSDRNCAELLRGAELFATREDMQDFISDEDFFIVDILGMSVVLTNGEKIGSVIDITQANVDIFTVQKLNGKILRFPFLKVLSPKVDAQNRTLTLDAERFVEVACYED